MKEVKNLSQLVVALLKGEEHIVIKDPTLCKIICTVKGMQ